MASAVVESCDLLRSLHRPGDPLRTPAAARIARGVDVPVTVDAEAGYGVEPAELVAALRSAGAAGCNLEDGDLTLRIGPSSDPMVLGAHALAEAIAEATQLLRQEVLR